VSDGPLVLCADDDEDILALVALRLGRVGYRVVTAGDGAQALASAREHLPALAVLDVMMPRLSGLEVVAELRRDERLRAVKVILLSARVQELDLQRGLDAGADLYLIKPFRFEELEEAVARLLAEPG
jgi:CheY-like chemotaxis protein